MPTTVEKLYYSVIGGMQDNNIKFKDLQNLLDSLGFEHRIRDGRSIEHV